jgi:hypothetical protein
MSVVLVDGITATFEVAWTTAPFAVTPTWVDETANLRTVTVNRSHDALFDHYGAGTMTAVLDNSGRRYDSTYASSPLVGTIKPRRRCRFSVTYNAVTYRWFTGFLDGIDQTGELSNHLGLATFRATDGFKMLGRARLPTGGASIGDGETLSARVARLLDYPDWPAADRDIDPNSPTTVETQEGGQTVLQSLYEVLNGDLGRFYIAGDGKATYHGHAWELANNLTATATIGDGGGTEIPYVDYSFNNDDTLIFNRWLATNYTGSNPNFVLHASDIEDAASIGEYQETAKDLGLIGVNNMNVVQNTLEYGLAFYKDPKLRVVKAAFERPASGIAATAYPALLGAEIGARWNFKRRPQAVGAAIDQDVIVQGMTRTLQVQPELGFSCEFDLQQAPVAPDGGTFWRMGFGKWTTGSPSATWA